MVVNLVLVAFRALLQLRGDEELLDFVIPRHAQDIRFAADLAVFHVLLTPSGGRVYVRSIPLTTACTLEASYHRNSVRIPETSRQIDDLSISI
jgi:hypothetical protein